MDVVQRTSPFDLQLVLTARPPVAQSQARVAASYRLLTEAWYVETQHSLAHDDAASVASTDVAEGASRMRAQEHKCACV